jgi:hypothetical protein
VDYLGRRCAAFHPGRKVKRAFKAATDRLWNRYKRGRILKRLGVGEPILVGSAVQVAARQSLSIWLEKAKNWPTITGAREGSRDKSLLLKASAALGAQSLVAPNSVSK